MVNKTILQGRFTRTPELRQTATGTSVASFSVAWSEKYNDNENTVFMPCVAWGKTAESVCRHFDKGQEALVEGRLSQRKYTTKEGVEREIIELIADRVHFCGTKREQQQARDDNDEYEDYTGEILPF